MEHPSTFVRRLFVAALVAAFGVAGMSLPGAGAADVSSARQAADRAVAELAEADEELTALTDELNSIQSEAEDLGTQVNGLRSKVAEIAVARYVSGGTDLSIFRAVGDIGEIERSAVLAGIVAGGYQETIDRYVVARSDHAERVAELEAAIEQRRSVVAQLRERRDDLAERLRTLEEAQRATRATRTSRAASSTATPAGTISGTGWRCPVQGAVAFTNDWGDRRSGGRSHKGTDMFAPRGTPVVAPVSGTVTLRGTRLGGLSFFLTGDDGNSYFGTHMASYGASGRVAAGTVIGTVGNSGNARGSSPHLHFEIRPRGGAQTNPYPVLSQHC